MIEFKVNNKFKSRVKRIKMALNDVPKQAIKVWIANTAVRSGNARRRTSLQGKTIHARYPYAKRLDEGYSKQFPKGMSKPTEEFVIKRVKDIFKGIK